MEFSRNTRRNDVLTYMGFEYNKFRENSTTGVITWRCKQYRSFRCKAFVRTDKGDIVAPPSPSHSHEPCPQKAIANIALSRMRDAIHNLGATPKNVIGSELSNLDSNILVHLPKKSSITRSLFRQKESVRLPNPETPNFPIPEKYQHLILHDSGVDDPDRILAIGDNNILKELDTDVIYGDGTFDRDPNIFFQLYTWHSKIGNSYPPCIYFLLLRKRMRTYKKMLKILKALLPNLAPQKVFVDFESTCINAIRMSFPNTEVKGCYFHLCQSIIKKINSVGMKAIYNANIDVRLQLKSIAAIAFVPIADVKNVFSILAETFPDDKDSNEVLSYFFTTFVEGPVRRDPQFPISVWNQYEAAAELSPRTINYCEEFHDRLNSLFYCSQPSVWSLFNGLEKDIAYHRVAYEKAKNGKPEGTKKKFENLYAQLSHVVQGYSEEEDKLQYLRRLANMQ